MLLENWSEGFSEELQGYLAYKQEHPPWDHHRTLRKGLQVLWLAISAVVSVFTVCTPSCDIIVVVNDVFGRR